MLHFVPQFEPEQTPEAYAEALARLAGLKHVLRLVDSGSGPADDLDDGELVAALDQAGEAKTRCFDNRSGRIIAATADGLDALLAERNAGREPHEAATAEIGRQLRASLHDLSAVLTGGTQTRAVFAMPDALPIAL